MRQKFSVALRWVGMMEQRSESCVSVLNAWLQWPSLALICTTLRHGMPRLALLILRALHLCRPAFPAHRLERRLIRGIYTVLLSYNSICGHRALKAPHPVRSAKLSRASPSQYCGGGPRGNPGCCSSLILLLFASLFLRTMPYTLELDPNNKQKHQRLY